VTPHLKHLESHAERYARLRKMLWQFGQIIGTHEDDPKIVWFAQDGKAYCDLGDTVVELGDYFLFLENVRASRVPGFKPADSLTARLHKSFCDHLALAGKYERGGNTEGARYLRYVSNLLAGFLRGESPKTILPE